MNNKGTVSIITVNHNGKDYLRSCLDSLLKIDKVGHLLEIIVVDNLSKDGFADFVRSAFREVTIIESGVNNYAKGLNLGIEQSRGYYIAIVNNDTTVEKEWFKGLVEVMGQDEKIGVVQSKILFSDRETINSVGVEQIEDFYFADIGFNQKDVGKYEKIREPEYFSGGSCAKKPMKLSELQEVYDQAPKVPRSKLDGLAQEAVDGVKCLWEQGYN